MRKLKVNAKLANRQYKRLSIFEKIQVNLFAGVLTLLGAVVLNWAQSGFISDFGGF